jgi:hypothetical protein
MVEDLLKKLLALRAELETKAIAEVRKQAEKTAARTREGTGSTEALNPKKPKKAELEQELRKRNIPVDREQTGKRQAHNVLELKKRLCTALERDAAVAIATRTMAELTEMEQVDVAGAAQLQPRD